MSARHHLRKALLAALLLGSVQATAQYVRIDNASRAGITSRMNALIAANGLVGGAVGIVRNGEIVYMEGFGDADRENNIPADECTLFRIGSVAKTFTAIAALQLEAEGRIDLINDDVRKYVPSYPSHGEYVITPHLLLTHRSGITDSVLSGSDYWLEQPSHNAVEAVETFKHLPLEGTTTPLTYNYAIYSNYGYNLLGAVIQQAADQPYEQLIHDRIFRPLEMPRAQADYRWRHNSNHSKYYEVYQILGLPGWHTAVNGSAKGDIIEYLPCGGFLGSVTDMCLFAKGFGNGSLLSTPQRDRMKTPYCNLEGRGHCGYALYNEESHGETYYYTGGGIAGGSCIIVFSEDFQDAVIIVANALASYNAGTKSLAFDILDERGTITLLPGAAYDTGPLPTYAVNVVSDKSSDFTLVANSISVSSTMETGIAVRLEGDNITLLPGFSTEPLVDFLAHAGNPNELCMDQGIGGAPRMAGVPPAEAPLEQLDVFPNPSRGRVTIRCGEGLSAVAITDLTGRVLLRHDAGDAHEAELILDHLAAGTYLAQVTHGGKTTVRRLVLTD